MSAESMNRDELAQETEDDLREEYDLSSLKVRRLGPGRKRFGNVTVQLEPDVAAMFPDADSVNEALRFLIRITRESSDLTSGLEIGSSSEKG